MRTFKTAWSLVAAIGSMAPTGAWSANHPLDHLDLEMTGAEYARVLEARDFHRSLEGPAPLDAADGLEPILAVGKRNLDWLVLINGARAGQDPLSFTSAETQQAFPLDAPRAFNPKIVQALYADWVAKLPREMKSVLVDGAPVTERLPTEEKTYLDLGREGDRVYQLAARWRLLEPYLPYLSQRKKQDVRGFYFLSKVQDLKSKLQDLARLPITEREQLSQWLVGVCSMRASERACQKELNKAAQKGTVWDFYQSYLPQAQKTWDAFFVIPKFRNDIQWTASNPNLTLVPFTRPPTQTLVDFLMNIEDEWRYKNWRLKLDFKNVSSPDMTHLAFEAGATPHVNDLAGSIITMDANAPLTEYTVQWAIRHEYGHTLGFPDCYLEFYDSARGEMISYQLDTTNLMCSRRGRLQEKHYTELRRVYYTGDWQKTERP